LEEDWKEIVYSDYQSTSPAAQAVLAFRRFLIDSCNPIEEP